MARPHPRDVLPPPQSRPSSHPPSLLPIVAAADNFPFPSPYSHSHPSFPAQLAHPGRREVYVPFHLTLSDFQTRPQLPPVGWIRPEVADAMADAVSEDGKNVWTLVYSSEGMDIEVEGGEMADAESGESGRLECIFFSEWVVEGGSETMCAVMKRVVEDWKKEGKFRGPLDGWRNELYSVYAPAQSSFFSSSDPSSGSRSPATPLSNIAFALERSACAIFGLPTFGVHLTAYEGSGADMQIWVPRRSATKATWPGRLDNSVAGGIPHGLTPAETIVKECDEEASLPESLVRERIRNVSVTTYFYITQEGYLQPEIEYIYDLHLPERSDPSYVKPHPHDDEVESFALLSIPEVVDALHTGDFKPNCGLILVDFLVRHGFVTPENETNYIEIAARMRRKLEVALPGHL